ncbi:MAG: AAA family ATPase [Coprococcus sp.]|nr:AAA family ATPase [Coprococcus sp.]
MSRGTDFLTLVIKKLKQRLCEIDEVIREVQKDIEGMNEYYWENYTEMDQYGYENYDNQQALLTQVNEKQEKLKDRHRLKRMVDAPFFGSIDFRFSGEEEAETFYIGIASFSEKKGETPLIYDWRAPVSSLFYDYDKGDASYEAPGGKEEGEILTKWQYKIRSGRMVYELESDIKIDDEILRQELSANSDAKLRSIVRTIQREQNAIIRNKKDKILVIQGAAGSGKTSIALHRIAYLLYHDRKHLKSSNILILSPGSVFSDYISHILPELGEERIQEMSFDLFAWKELRSVVADCEDRWHQTERRIKRAQGTGRPKENGKEEKRIQEDRWKQSEGFVRAVSGFQVELEDRLVDFQDITYRGTRFPAEKVMNLFYFKFHETPLLERMESVMEYFIDEYETLHSCVLPEEDKEELREKFGKMYATRDLYEIYNWLLEEYGCEKLPDLPVEKRFLGYADVYPLLYLKYRLMRITSHRNIRHLVIDEMQDYSYLQYVILECMFSCNMTILGDRAQTVAEENRDVLTFLPRIFGKRIRCIEMNKSYRNTIEIAKYAEKIGQVSGIQYIKRHGKAVEEQNFSAQEEALSAVLDVMRAGEDVCEEIACETSAVLVMTEKEAKQAYEYLKRYREDVLYIDRDSTVLGKGLTVTTFYMAKGLEFDRVFIVGGEKENAFFRQFQYISATRALHELYVYDTDSTLGQRV